MTSKTTNKEPQAQPEAKFKRPEWVMLHHTALSHEKNPDQFKANNTYHQSMWEFKSTLGFYLGYHYEISKAGRAHKAREDGEPSAACYQQDMNDGRCIHIALDGNFDIEKPAPAQIYKLRDLLNEKVKAYGINKNNIVFHNAYASKSCPGSNVELPFIRSLVSPNALQDEQTTKEKIVKVAEYLVKLLKNL